MKKLVLAAAMMTSSIAFADVTVTQIKGSEAIKKQMIADFMNQGKYEGELDEIGGWCSVQFEKGPEGEDMLVLKTEKGLELVVPFYGNDEYTRKMDQDPDSSFAVEYTETEFEVNTVRAVNLEDAYHYIVVETPSSKLTCGNWF